MDLPEVRQPGTPPPTVADLRAWDWHAELERQERDIMWLARKMGVGHRSIYRYRDGLRTPTIEWLRAAWQVLGR